MTYIEEPILKHYSRQHWELQVLTNIMYLQKTIEQLSNKYLLQELTERFQNNLPKSLQIEPKLYRNFQSNSC